ncbi:hypothetical protein EDF52_10283 [Curtobacterium sp. PhB42]|uniref:hypothetical protein n=1 Tax=unclassified Curtobacterium TaxID=257496 RepID=UPI0010643434|nr:MULTISPECIES: hypothetical protein [unclassified Curtobacterium]TDW50995.1 hypothetical protein EDF52_10283 [Curtobacterium sp. PhB42]TDW56159.1 hypothetical protein EDF47_104270 [Curtobacterium sp. PhB190]
MARRKAPSRYRGWVIENLKPLLPRTWDLSPYSRLPDAVDKTTVVVWLQNITRLPEAPLASHVTEYTVTIVSPRTSPTEADADLDDDIADLLHALDNVRNEQGSPNLRWTRAERAVYAESFLAFDITVSVITTATQTQE